MMKSSIISIIHAIITIIWIINLNFCREFIVHLSLPSNRSGRWKVTNEEFSRPYYPKYCSGSSFILSTDLSAEFVNISKYVPFVWVDDAYLTGLLTEALGNVTFEYLNHLYTFYERKSYDSLLFVHTGNAAVIRQLWMKAVEVDSSKQ